MNRLFIYIVVFAGILLTTASSGNPGIAHAHETLPVEYLEFSAANPNYTPEQYEAFLNAHPLLKADADFLQHVESAKVDPNSIEENMRNFVRLGIFHILSGPDHILFVLSIVLVYTTLYREFLLLTVFTIAHSISLVLAGTGLVVLSSKLVEPVVAFSITYMAITSVFFKHLKIFEGHGNKALTVFVFGLFHGLGFAGLLTSIQVPENRFLLSLFSFNVGIEIGQLGILLIILPFIFAFRNAPWYPRAIQGIAILIALIGFVWGVQRLL
jgi:hydrogenase/urease accessory protein HupE